MLVQNFRRDFLNELGIVELRLHLLNLAFDFSQFLSQSRFVSFDINQSFLVLFMVIIGGLGSLIGSYFGAALIFTLPIVLGQVLPAAAGLVGIRIGAETIEHIRLIVLGLLIIVFLIVEPHGLARLWQIGKQKLRVWPFPY